MLIAARKSYPDIIGSVFGKQDCNPGCNCYLSTAVLSYVKSSSYTWDISLWYKHKSEEKGSISEI